jgi:hypothetical protein
MRIVHHVRGYRRGRNGLLQPCPIMTIGIEPIGDGKVSIAIAVCSPSDFPNRKTGHDLVCKRLDEAMELRGEEIVQLHLGRKIHFIADHCEREFLKRVREDFYPALSFESGVFLSEDRIQSKEIERIWTFDVNRLSFVPSIIVLPVNSGFVQRFIDAIPKRMV